MKKIFWVFLSVLVIYLVSFFAMAKSVLAEQLINDTNSAFNSYKWTSDILVISNFELNELVGLNSYFDAENAEIKYQIVGSHESLIDIKRKPKVYYYYLIMEAFMPLVTVKEYENIEEYLAAWEKQYIWCFYKWVKLKDDMIGVS